MPTTSSPLRPEWADIPQETFRETYRGLRSIKDLASLWQVPASQISYYALKADKAQLYTPAAIRRRHGRPRTIEVPSPTLKYLQRIAHESLTRIYGPHPAVHGFRTGRSIVTNAKRHVDRKFVLNIDLRDFFGSITRERIFGRLTSAPYDFDTRVANAVASLATNATATLPQGSPCSPVISNMVAAQMDSDLAQFSASQYCLYTRYADDITISTKRDSLSPQIARYPSSRGTGQVILGDRLLDILEGHNFRINRFKTRLQSHWTRQMCTGLIVNGKDVSVPRAYVRRLRSLLHHWAKNGWEDAALALASEEGRRSFTERTGLENHVRGRLDYIMMVRGPEDPVYQQMAEKFQAIPDDH